MTVVFVFKNGFELPMKCKEFELQKDAFGNVDGFSAKGVVENKPVSLNMRDILCIYRIMSDEESDTE